MYETTSIWEIKWELYSTEKTWLQGDILDVYVVLNSLEAVNKN